MLCFLILTYYFFLEGIETLRLTTREEYSVSFSGLADFERIIDESVVHLLQCLSLRLGSCFFVRTEQITITTATKDLVVQKRRKGQADTPERTNDTAPARVEDLIAWNVRYFDLLVAPEHCSREPVLPYLTCRPARTLRALALGNCADFFAPIHEPRSSVEHEPTSERWNAT